MSGCIKAHGRGGGKIEAFCTAVDGYGDRVVGKLKHA
jgi:hypothetical protein